MAQHFGVRDYVGFDHSTTSLAVARELAAELKFPNASFAEGDLFALPYPDESFDVIAGADVERRFDVAYELYGSRPLSEMSPADIAGFYDQYCHPHKSDHTVGETLGWLDREGLQYWGSYPPLGFKDFLAMAQFRGRMAGEYPGFHTSIAASIVRLAMTAPQVTTGSPPFRFPTVFHRFMWQPIYAIQGSRGKHSGGPAVCGRKVQ